ncbi:MAG: efflux RND transporter periplasmic adaptor subunit, partial [Pseudomonadota bacterium]
MKVIHSTILCAILMLLGASVAHAADEHGHDEAKHATEATHSDDEADHDDEDNHEEKEDEDGHGHGGHGGEKKSDAELSAEQVKMANIEITELRSRPLDYQIHAPGEIKSNGYSSYRVSARTPSIVLRRHVALGETVALDQKLVTLFSDEVAEAQAAYRVAASEWQRVKALGRQAVGDKRYVGAQGDMEASLGKLEAYGLSESDIQALESGAKVKLGEYTLRAVAAGVV